MARWVIPSMVCMFLLTGCGDRRQPNVRRTSTERESAADTEGGVSCPAMAPGDSRPRMDGSKLPEIESREVYLGALRLTAPDDWIRRPPRSGFTLAEFSLPRSEGDAADGRLTVTLAGGTVEANAARWRQQFGGEPDEELQKELEVAGLRVTLVDFSGVYAAAHGMFAPVEQKSCSRMLGAIFPVGDQLGFIKLTGPRKTVADHADAFHTFVRSLESHEDRESGRPDPSDPSNTPVKPPQAAPEPGPSSDAS